LPNIPKLLERASLTKEILEIIIQIQEDPSYSKNDVIQDLLNILKKRDLLG
jgi:hypothetical protein